MKNGIENETVERKSLSEYSNTDSQYSTRRQRKDSDLTWNYELLNLADSNENEENESIKINYEQKSTLLDRNQYFPLVNLKFKFNNSDDKECDIQQARTDNRENLDIDQILKCNIQV